MDCNYWNGHSHGVEPSAASFAQVGRSLLIIVRVNGAGLDVEAELKMSHAYFLSFSAERIHEDELR